MLPTALIAINLIAAIALPRLVRVELSIQAMPRYPLGEKNVFNVHKKHLESKIFLELSISGSTS